MIELKKSEVRVRCVECKEENFLNMKLIGSEQEESQIVGGRTKEKALFNSKLTYGK